MLRLEAVVQAEYSLIVLGLLEVMVHNRLVRKAANGSAPAVKVDFLNQTTKSILYKRFIAESLVQMA